MIIYCIKNKINNKCYIGQTIRSLKKRIWYHLDKNSGCWAIHKALKKYGIENFDISVIDDSATTMDELNALEKKYILEYDCISPKGYNLNNGGKNYIPSDETRKKISESHKGEKHPLFGKKHTEETRKKMSVSRKERVPPMLGKHHSEESKKRIGASSLGRNHSEETRRKMSLAQIGEKHPMFGKKHTLESRKLMSEATSGERNGFFGKKHTNATKLKIAEKKIGKIASDETRKKMRESHKGEKSYFFGKKHTDETKLKLSKINSGNNSSNAKLNEEQVIKIKWMLLHKISGIKIAKLFNISNTSIYAIKNNIAWKYVSIPKEIFEMEMPILNNIRGEAI